MHLNMNRVVSLLWLGLLAGVPGWSQNFYYFPFAADRSGGDGSLRTSMLIGNPGVTAAKVTIAWTKDDGSPRPVTLSDLGLHSEFSLTLEPGATRTLQTSGSGDDPGGAAVIGSDQVLSVWGVLAAFNSSEGPLGETGFAAAGTSTGFRVPVDATSGLNTGLALYNPGKVPAAVTASLMDAGGIAIGSKTLTIAPGRRVTRFVSGDLFGALDSFRGTLDVKSTVALAVQAIRKNDSSPLTALLQATPLTSKRMRFYFPRLADGPSITATLHTTFVLTNLASKPATVTMTLAREDGSPWSVAIPGMDPNSTFKTILAPGASKFWQTDGASPYTTGAASIRSDRPIGVQALVTASDAQGITLSETAAGDAKPLQRFILPFDTDAGLSSEAAFYNPGTRPVTITLSLLGADGKIAASTQLSPVAPGGYLTGGVADFFPGTTVMRGALSATTGDFSAPFVAALAVRKNRSLAWTSTLPAAAIPLAGVPIKVTATLDERRAVPAAIGPKGGSLSLTNAGGDKFTLTIPPNALFSTETIAMTPVTAANGLPGTGLVSVQLAPEGLLMLQPATLTIQPAAASASQGTFTPVGWQGSSPGVYLNPLLPKNSQFTMLIKHFSYAGGTTFRAGDLTSVLLNIIDVQTFYESEVSAALAAHKGMPELPEDFFELTYAQWTGAIEPLIEAALAIRDEDVIRCAMAHAFGYLRQLQLLGDDAQAEEIGPAVHDFLVAGLEIAVSSAEKRCTQDHDFTALQDLLGYYRQQLLYGISVGSFDLSAFEKQCPVNLRFDFTSQMKTTVTGLGVYNGQMSAKLPLYGSWDKKVLTQVNDPSKDLLANYVLFNSGPLTYDNFSFVLDDRNCSVAYKLRPGQLSVLPFLEYDRLEESSQLQFMFSAGYDPSAYSISGVQLCAYCPVYRKKLVKVDVMLDTGLSWEDLVFSCPMTENLNETALWWVASWLAAHPTDDMRGYTPFPNWDLVVSADVLAEKKSNATGKGDGFSTTETTKMTLTRISNSK